MLHWVPDPNRSSLGFVATVRAAFAFLEDDFGFSIARIEEPTFVRYESASGFVNVYHARGGYNIGAEIGRLVPFQGRRIEDLITLFEVAAADGNESDQNILAKPAQTQADVAAGVAHAARLVRTYATGLLRGDDLALKKAKEYRTVANRRRAEIGARLWEVRKAANRALEQGDRDEAIRLFQILDEHGVMTQDDRARLAADKIDPVDGVN